MRIPRNRNKQKYPTRLYVYNTFISNWKMSIISPLWPSYMIPYDWVFSLSSSLVNTDDLLLCLEGDLVIISFWNRFPFNLLLSPVYLCPPRLLIELSAANMPFVETGKFGLRSRCLWIPGLSLPSPQRSKHDL